MSDLPDSYFVNGVELLNFRREPNLGIFGPGEVKRGRNKRKAAPKRSFLLLRDGDICHYCENKMETRNHRSPNAATVEHIVPRSLGGGNASYNLVLACSKCNGDRGSEYYKCHCLFCKEARNQHENTI